MWADNQNRTFGGKHFDDALHELHNLEEVRFLVLLFHKAKVLLKLYWEQNSEGIKKMKIQIIENT